jgi:ornithine decarboxylase
MPPVIALRAPERLYAADLPHFASVPDAITAYEMAHGDDHINVIFPQRISAAAFAFVQGLPGQPLYAVKSNPHPAVLQAAWDGGIRGFDVASIREIKLVRNLFPYAQIFLMHPVKSRQTIRFAYAQGVRDFSFDHIDELQKLIDETGEATDLKLHLRIAVPKSKAALPLAGKFGAAFEEAVTLLRQARPFAAKLGLCFHVGSQCLEVEAYDRAICYARTLVNTAAIKIDTLDIGGGFPVAYPDMETRPWSEYFTAIRKSLSDNDFETLEIFGEPGRAICAEGGATLARVELRKGTDLYLNDGTYGTLFDAGHFAWKYPVKLHRNRPPAPVANTVGFRFFGPTCDSADTMNGPFNLPADTVEGDWVEIGNLGAYGQTLATQFNGFHSDYTVIVTENQ